MRKIQKTVCREELKSRIPGLFAYVEENDAGEFILHKATDSKIGCYGKIIESIELPENVSLEIDGKTLLNSGEIYSYRTIMSYFYQYKDKLTDDNSFKKFIIDGIGKVNVFDSLKLDEKTNDLAPHYVYIATARDLLLVYSKLKVIFDNYTDGDENFDINTLDSDICCAISKYIRMGGTSMYNELIILAEEADKVAEKYYSYAMKNTVSINLDLNLTQSIHDIGYLSCYLNEWVAGDKHFKGDLYTYGGNTYICKEDNTDTYDEDLMTFVFDTKYFQPISEKLDEVERVYTINGRADSKLKSLRRFKQYINGENIAETPSDGEDWLYYYKKGSVVNYTTINDDLGNIVSNSGLNKGVKEATDNVNDLAAYGNVITDITYDRDNFTITFEYVINAHLKADTCKKLEDDDGNVLYKFDGFYFDEAAKYSGVKYFETYNYEEGGELDNLIKGRIEGIIFEDYIEPSVDEKYTDFNKYAFVTRNSIMNYTKELDTQIVSIPYISSEYTATIKDNTDYLYADVFKTDYLDGITYKPEIENNVFIDRGNYSAFERHIRLSEVKTLEDMENYGNGSFFNVQKTN